MVCPPTLPFVDPSQGRYIDFVKSFALDFNSLHTNSLSAHTSLSQGAADLSVKSIPLTNGQGAVILAPSIHPEEDTPETSMSVPTMDASDDPVVMPPSQPLGPASIYFQSWQVNMIDIKIDYSPDQVTYPSPLFTLMFLYSWISRLCS